MRLTGILGTIFICLNLFACTGGEKNSLQEQIVKDVNATEFNQLYTEKGGQMVDVRTQDEVIEGYITGAINIDFYGEDFEKEITKLDKDEPVYVYCAAGGRSGKTKKKLKDMGFKEVYNLSGGFPTWLNAGYEISN